MNYKPLIHAEWQKAFAKMASTTGFRRIYAGEITARHYQEIMRQIFHHARENPQIQTLATVYFRGEQRNMVKMFFKHATSEIGHDMLALNDLKAMGVDTTGIPTERPLPSTTALLSYAFYQIQFRNPIGYLGYLYHLEFMPTVDGEKYLKAFMQAGVPDTALTFIQDHATIDIGHNKLMDQYIENLVKTQEDFDAVVYALNVTAKLYGDMVTEAIQLADLSLTAQRGSSSEEDAETHSRQRSEGVALL